MELFSQRPFHFRRFSLFHHRSTMKTGTDAVLLGAWLNTENTHRILDAGTGCGIIALMLAQRTQAIIDAIDIDKDSCEEASFNFSRSHWNKRLFVSHIDLKQYIQTANVSYDLIVSNPPFFADSVKTKHHRRNLARHNDSMSYEMLIEAAVTLLQNNGRLGMVMPHKEGELFLKQAFVSGLRLHRLLNIIPVRGRMPNRINFEIGWQAPIEEWSGEFVIRESNGSFTTQYEELLKDYYLGL